MNPDRIPGIEKRLDDVVDDVHSIDTKLEVLTAVLNDRSAQALAAIAARDRRLKRVATLFAIAQGVFYFAVLAAHNHLPPPL